jgi:RND family efflux transporter MFP subunit
LINWLIAVAIRNRFLVIAFFVLVAGWGCWALVTTPIDAIPDLSDNQVIVFTDWSGRSPQEVEDQITYPLTVSLQGLPGVRVVRSSSAFGFSMINVIFEDSVDLYFARSRVLERLNLLTKALPSGVVPTLGPDATGVGHVFWYTVEGPGQSLRELRAIQDWYVRYQDLEEITAVHEAHATEVEAARLRLQLLGLSAEQVRALTSPSQVVSTIVVPAPITGVITSRSANLGQVVAMGQELLSVTDLSEVWVVGDLYEQDFKTVTVGSEAAITTPAYPGLMLRGRVSYIDPRVDPQARTAKARIEVPNSDGRLRLGMYVTVNFTTPGGSVVAVPRSAVQAIGERQVVFIPAEGEDGKFTQRQVRLGPPIGANYTILSGLKPGETIVTEGSFFLRAEVLRNAPGG